MTTDTWDPAQYEKFRREREQPFRDLLALIQPTPSMRVLDLGCGTGRLTRALHESLHARQTIGVDRSARMLETATREPLPDGLRFELGTVESYPLDGQFDLLFSNAVFHWIEGHETLIPRLVNALNPGGQLAFQMPAMHRHPSHQAAARLAGDTFRQALVGWKRPQPVLEPEDYARLLFQAGVEEPRVRLEIYPHVLDRREDVVEWMKGALLTDYERHMSADEFAAFLAAYREELLPQLEDTHPYFFPFRRILCWGRRSP